MASIVYVKHKGYCLTDETIENDHLNNNTKGVTNGVQELPWDLYIPEEQQDSEDDGGSKKSPTHASTSPPKKLSKLEKREARQMKKVNASRRRKIQREQELDTNGVLSKIPEFKPFLAKRELKSLYNSILEGNTTKTDFKILQYHSIALYKSDLEHLLPGEWLNDNNISLIYELIIQMYIKSGRSFSNQIQILFPSVVQLLLHFPDDVEALLPIDDLKKLKFIFLPLNFIDEMDVDLEDDDNGDHWALGVLSLLDNTLYVYDSMQIDDDESTDIQLKKLAKKLQSCKSFVHGKIKIQILKCDQQQNFDDCGVYVIMISCYLINQFLFHNEISLDISKVMFNPLDARLYIMKLVSRLVKM